MANKGHSTVDFVLAPEICLMQSGLIPYLSVLDLNHLSDHCPIFLKLSSLNPISTKPMNVKLEEKQPQFKWKKHLRNTMQKGLAKKLS